MKIWACAEPSGYICNFQVYTGKKDGVREKGQGMRVVKDLVEPYLNEWREVTADNLFTSVELAENLFENKTLYTGTVRSNKPQVQPEFVTTKGRTPHDLLEGHNGISTLSSFYEKKGKKSVVMLTTKRFEQRKDEDAKPEVILYYNKTKGGVDVGDMKTRRYTCQRRTRVWSKKLFMEYIDIACLNGYHILSCNVPEWKQKSRSEYLRVLAEELAIDEIHHRLSSGHLSAQMVKDMEEFIEVFDEEHSLDHSVCSFCNKESTVICQTCKKLCCNEHNKELSVVICKKCKEEEDPDIKLVRKDPSRYRCQCCPLKRRIRTNSKCCCCEEFACRNCSFDLTGTFCMDCQE